MGPLIHAKGAGSDVEGRGCAHLVEGIAEGGVGGGWAAVRGELSEQGGGIAEGVARAAEDRDRGTRSPARQLRVPLLCVGL